MGKKTYAKNGGLGLIFILSYVKIHKDYPEVRESGERSN